MELGVGEAEVRCADKSDLFLICAPVSSTLQSRRKAYSTNDQTAWTLLGSTRSSRMEIR